MKNFCCTLLACILYLVGISEAEAGDRQHGFFLGSKFDDAVKNAKARGWTLTPISPHLPGQWQVEGADISLFVCRDKVLGVLEHLPGGFDEFVELVWRMKIETGLMNPDVKVTALPLGAARVRTIDARFSKAAGGITVQLQSIGGLLKLSRNHHAGKKCVEENAE